MTGAGYGEALQAIGGVLQSVAAEQAQEKMNQAFADMLARQQRYAQQAYGTWENALPGMGVETARQQMAQGQAHREDLYNQLLNSPSSATGPAMSARDSAFGRSTGQVRAKLGSYSDWELMQHINNIKTQNELNKISNFSQGWSSLLPLQLNQAQHSQDELAMFGSLISSIGGGAANYGSLFGGAQSAQPQTYNLNNGYGVSGGVGYDVPSSVDPNGNPLNPSSIFA